MGRGHRWWIACAAVASVAAAALACSDASGPGVPSQPGDERASLNVVRRSGAVPGFVDTVVTFYAVRGTDREGSIFFKAADGGPGEEFVKLSIGSAALLARPDGTPIAQGDSVLITMRIVDPALLLVEFLPSGLQFNPQEPAEMEMQYGGGDDDYNEDGHHDAIDTAIEATLGIWKQEAPGLPFVRLASTLLQTSRSSDAKITSFTRYALAY